MSPLYTNMCSLSVARRLRLGEIFQPPPTTTATLAIDGGDDRRGPESIRLPTLALTSYLTQQAALVKGLDRRTLFWLEPRSARRRRKRLRGPTWEAPWAATPSDP